MGVFIGWGCPLAGWAGRAGVRPPSHPHLPVCHPLFRRLLPHVLLGLLVLLQPGAFASWTSWGLATGGMAYMNAVNLRRGLDLLAPAALPAAAPAKPHAA